jgi:Saccharopine dehydrogenase C-terminal domain
LKMRVGALPQYPSNALNYNLTWSTDGVINEYCEPCEAIVNGELREVPPLEAREEFALDGVTYEAFNTSGGLGSLCETLKGKVDNLNYKTIRYPGHAAIMKALLQDLRLRERRYILKDILENERHETGPPDAGDLCKQDLQPSQGRLASERHPDYHGRRNLRRAGSARQRPPADQGIRSPGRHPPGAVSGQPLRPDLRPCRL